MNCTCQRRRVSAVLRDNVRLAQFEFLESIALRYGRKGLEEYLQILEKKHTWGLCPACDYRLREDTIQWINNWIMNASMVN